MQGEKTYWFPAKRYGWGWGFPTSWQGLEVLFGYIALLAGGTVWLRPDHAHGWFLAYALALTAVLLFICWLKGERPAWRWGDRD